MPYARAELALELEPLLAAKALANKAAAAIMSNIERTKNPVLPMLAKPDDEPEAIDPPEDEYASG